MELNLGLVDGGCGGAESRGGGSPRGCTETKFQWWWWWWCCGPGIKLSQICPRMSHYHHTPASLVGLHLRNFVPPDPK